MVEPEHLCDRGVHTFDSVLAAIELAERTRRYDLQERMRNSLKEIAQTEHNPNGSPNQDQMGMMSNLIRSRSDVVLPVYADVYALRSRFQSSAFSCSDPASLDKQKETPPDEFERRLTEQRKKAHIAAFMESDNPIEKLMEAVNHAVDMNNEDIAHEIRAFMFEVMAEVSERLREVEENKSHNKTSREKMIKEVLMSPGFIERGKRYCTVTTWLYATH